MDSPLTISGIRRMVYKTIFVYRLEMGRDNLFATRTNPGSYELWTPEKGIQTFKSEMALVNAVARILHKAGI